MTQTGKRLTMKGESIYKGDVSHNGTLLKLHENCYTIGYSALFAPDESQAGVVKFGDGVFLDANQKNNKVYVGKPTVAGAVPVFAGIVVREPAIASGYPVNNDEIASFQKGLLCREGYVVYKKALVNGVSTTETVGVYDSGVTYGWNIFVRNTDGKVCFASTESLTNYTRIGKVVEVNPDDKSVTVKIVA